MRCTDWLIVFMMWGCLKSFGVICILSGWLNCGITQNMAALQSMAPATTITTTLVCRIKGTFCK